MLRKSRDLTNAKADVISKLRELEAEARNHRRSNQTRSMVSMRTMQLVANETKQPPKVTYLFIQIIISFTHTHTHPLSKALSLLNFNLFHPLHCLARYKIVKTTLNKHQYTTYTPITLYTAITTLF